MTPNTGFGAKHFEIASSDSGGLAMTFLLRRRTGDG
jgi:hypothetical protein